VFVDFDGTLSPIVDDPAAARPTPGAVGALAALAGRVGAVAVISGRPAGFLVEHLGAAGVALYGLYGLEVALPGGVRCEPEGEAWRAAIGQAAADAGAELPPGAAVEAKGLTVTLHYRGAPGRAAEVRALAAGLAGRLGLVAHPGKMSVELRPPVAVDKGTVLQRLAGGLAVVAYAGDDLGDLPAFGALRRLAASGASTLAVAAGGPETPVEVVEAADVVLDGPAGVVAWLDRIGT
jgi:trehalose 6-phosphate phosphatase